MVAAVMVFVLVVGLVLGIYAAARAIPKAVAERRLELRLHDVSPIVDDTEESVLKQEPSGPLPGVDRLLTRAPGTASLTRLTEELEGHGKLIDERQQSFRDGQLSLNQLNQEIEQHKSAILDLMRRLAQTNQHLREVVGGRAERCLVIQRSRLSAGAKEHLPAVLNLARDEGQQTYEQAVNHKIDHSLNPQVPAIKMKLEPYIQFHSGSSMVIHLFIKPG